MIGLRIAAVSFGSIVRFNCHSEADWFDSIAIWKPVFSMLSTFGSRLVRFYRRWKPICSIQSTPEADSFDAVDTGIENNRFSIVFSKTDLNPIAHCRFHSQPWSKRYVVVNSVGHFVESYDISKRQISLSSTYRLSSTRRIKDVFSAIP